MFKAKQAYLYRFLVGEPPLAIGSGRVLLLTSIVRRCLQLAISLVACGMVLSFVMAVIGLVVQQLGALLSISSATLASITLVISVVVLPVVAIASFVGTWKLLDKGVEKPPLEGGWRGLAIAALLTVGILLVGVLVAVATMIAIQILISLFSKVVALFG